MIETEAFLTELDEQIKKGFPLVAYRKPTNAVGQQGLTRAFLQQDKEKYIAKSFDESGFIFAPFNTKAKALLIPEDCAREITTEYTPSGKLKKLQDVKVDFPPPLFTDKDQIAHEKLVQEAIDAINRGTFKKVVISRKENVETQLSAVNIFRSLLKKYINAFVYIWFHPETGIWLGATPEMLLQVERNSFNTMALAGTQAFKEKTNVEWGEKEKEEQQIVTDYIVENLQKVIGGEDNETGKGTVEKSEPYTTKAGSLLHLRTDITGRFNPEASGVKTLIDALHPTPAVCGMPKEAALGFILEKENYNREFYTGFLGELNLKTEIKRNTNKRNQENQAYGSIKRQTSLYVNLRCLKLKEGRAHIFVGGGITKDSNAALEWEETVDKSHTMKSVLVK